MPSGSRPIRVSIVGDSSNLSKVLKGASGKVAAFGKSVAKVGLTAGVAFAGAATAIATKGVTAFSTFDKGMREIRTLLPDISNEAFGAMEKDLLSFSKEFGVLTDDAIPAAYAALSAGVSKDNLFEFMRVGQMAAKGGVTDLETAIDGITSVTNAYGTEIISATEASDLMFTAVKLGKTTMDEVSKSIFQMAPIASAVGVGFDQLTTSVAVLTSQGVPTATAAVQIKGALGELSRAGSKADVAFQDLAGVGFQDFIKQGGTFGEAIQMMADGADASGESLLSMFGSIEAAQAVLALTSDGGEAFNDVLGQMKGSAGATETAFDVMNTGLSASMDKIKANIQVLMIEIGAKLAPVAEKATALMIKGFDKLKPALKRGKELAIELATAARERLVPIFERAREIFGIVAEKVMAIYDAVHTYLAPGITTLKDKIVELLELGFNKLVEIFNSINWGEVGETIAAAFETAREKVMAFVRGIPDGFRTAIAWMERNKDVLIVLAGAIGGLVIGYGLYTAAVMIHTKMQAAWNVVQAVTDALMKTSPVMLVVVALVALTGALIAAYFRFERVRKIVDSVFHFLRDDFVPGVVDVKDKVVAAFFAMKDYLERVFWPAIEVIIDVVVDYFKYMKKQIKLVIDMVKAIFQGDWKEATKIFVELIGNAIKFAVDFFIKLPGRLLKALPPIMLALAFIAKQFVIFLADKVAKVMDKIVDFFIALPGKLLDAGVQIAVALFEMGVDWGKSIINAIVEGLRRAGGAIASFIMGLIPDVGSIVDSIVGGARSKASSLVKGLIPGLASGGIVTKPTLAVIGESGPEAVIPLSRAGQMGGTTINLTINAGVGTDGVQVGDDIVAALAQWSRQNGALPLSVSAA